MKTWEKKVLGAPGAADRVAVIEDELRLAAGLTALRERAGLSQRELAQRLGVSQPRVAAIERSRNVTLDVLEQYVTAVGGQLEITVRTGSKKLALLGPAKTAAEPQTSAPAPTSRRKRTAKTA
jgi:transcriptional regulator with XRE-family HTH domain